MRIVWEQFHTDSVEPVGRNNVSGEWLSGQRIDDRFRSETPCAVAKKQQTAEISSLHFDRRHRCQLGYRLRQTQTLVAVKEKRFVLDDGPAEHSAKLVTLKRWRLPLLEEIPRVHVRVAKKFVRRAVEFIGARLCRDDDLATRSRPVLRAINSSQNVELLDSVDRRPEVRRGNGRIVVIHA